MSAPENPEDKEHVTLSIGARQITIGHPERLYFPEAGLCKLDLVQYYAQVGAHMARYTAQRALSLKRYPRGIGEKGFFQKRVGSYFPDWIARARLPIKEGELEYAVGGDAASLVWLANLGTIEFHAMLSRIDKPRLPDQIIFDLDPPEEYCDEIRQAALGLKAICDDLGLASFVKSTGSRSFHVVVPIRRDHDFDDTRAFAKLLAARLIEAQPGRLSLELPKAKRHGRILVDVWRNGYGQSAVAPFSVRARPGAPVALPLAWSDLATPDIHPRAVTIANFHLEAARWRSAWPARLGPAQPIGPAWQRLKG